MKALVQIVNCTSDHLAFTVVPVVWHEGEVDDWSTCNDNEVDPVHEAGYRCGVCEQCGDTSVRAEYVCLVDDDFCVEYADKAWDSICMGCKTDSYGRPYDKRNARDELARRIDNAESFVDKLRAAFPGLADGETDVNGADLVDWINNNI